MFVDHLPQFKGHSAFHLSVTEMPSMAVDIRTAYLLLFIPINRIIDMVLMYGRDASIIVRNVPQDVEISSIK